VNQANKRQLANIERQQRRKNELAVGPSHQDDVSHHPAQKRREETHSLPNQAIGHALVAIQRRSGAKKLTVYQIKPSGTR